MRFQTFKSGFYWECNQKNEHGNNGEIATQNVGLGSTHGHET